MAVANPGMHQSWSEYKKQREEGRIRRLSWIQRVMGWDKLDANEESEQETEDDEDEDVSEEDVQGKRLEGSRKSKRKQSRCQDLEEYVQAKIDRMLGRSGKMEDDEDDDDDDDGDEEVFDGEVQDKRLKRNRKILEKQRASQHLEKLVQEKMEKTFEKWRKTDFETPIQALGNMERVYQENQEAGGSCEQYFERENRPESTEFERLSRNSDSFSFSEDGDFKQPQAEDLSDNTDAVTKNVDELDLDLAMGNAEVVANQMMDNLPFEVHSVKKDSSDEEDVAENGQREENGGEQFEQHSEFQSSGQSMASGISENGELYCEESHYQDTEENEDVEMSIFENLTEIGEAKTQKVEECAAKPKDESESDYFGQNSASSSWGNWEQYHVDSYYQETEKSKDLEGDGFENLTEDGVAKRQEVEEPATKPKYESEFHFSVENSASGISEGGELDYEESYNQDTEEAEDVDVSRFGNLTENARAKTPIQGEVEEPASKPKDDSEFDYSGETSASSISENGELYYEESFYQDTEEDKDLEVNRFEFLTEDGSERGELDYEEFCNQNIEIAKNFEDDGLEDLAKDDGVETSTQGKVEEVAKPADEHLTEEEATTTDEDDDTLVDEDTDRYDLNEIKMYRQDNHVNKIFQALNEFRDAQILTDLEVKTSDGKSIHVHAIVFSALCHLARRYLSKQHTWFWDRKIELMQLGPEVEYNALEAVVEFAYTGAIQCLNALNAGEIKTAARYLSASRVMDICDRELTKNKGKSKEKIVPASTELRKNLQKIEELWKNEMGCDVTLDVISASFQVHKVILAACSDYFRAMFTLGMKESSQSSIYLKFLSAPELEALLDCSYTGSISLSWNCIFEITSTALQLQYQPALDLCLNFLQREINPHCCLDVASFAEAFGIIKLLEHAEDYVLRQFQKVSRTPKFKDLPANSLLKYLNSFALCVPSELVVFRAVVDWIQAKPKRRLKLAKELMKTIHFPLMTFKEFKEVQALNMWSNHSLKELYEAIFEDFCSNEIETLNKCRIYLPKESLVLSGGDQISEDLGTRSISKDLWFGNSLRNHTGIKKAMEWRRLGEMPQPARFSHEVAVIQGQLYILGGKKYYGTADTLSSFFRYNPLENTWEELSPMHQARSSFSLVVLESKLYAIGGQSHPDYLETVEQYCPTANSWSFTCPLELPLGGHVARVLAGQIFISGGLNNDYDCLSSMFAYRPDKGSTYLENMARPRALHCMEVLGDFLYVAGGLSQSDGAEIVDMLACEMYNPEADSWTQFPPLPVPHVGSGSAVLEGKFYVLGGYSQMDYSDTKMVHRYDPATQQWENMGKMPGPNNDLRACVLGLPEHLRLCPD